MSPATASAASHHTVTLLLVPVLALVLLLLVSIGMVLAPSSRFLTAFTGTNKRHTRSRVSCYDETASGATTPELYNDDSTADSLFCTRSALLEPRCIDCMMDNGVSSKCAAAWCTLEREGGPVYHQHTGLQIEGSMVLRGLVCELAFIYSPIHSSYHVSSRLA